MAFQSGALPQIRQFGGTAAGPVNAGAPIGTWVRGHALYTGSANDRLKLGATSVTGVNTGNTGATGFRFGAGLSTGVQASQISLAEIFATNYEPGAGQLAALDVYVADQWGGSVAV